MSALQSFGAFGLPTHFENLWTDQFTQLSTARLCPWCQQRGRYHDDTVDHLLDVCPAKGAPRRQG
jgi:hypothetical protein